MPNQQLSLGFPDMEVSEKVRIGSIVSKNTYADFSSNYAKILEDIIKSWDKGVDIFAKKMRWFPLARQFLEGFRLTFGSKSLREFCI
jgi:hypothetical protein